MSTYEACKLCLKELERSLKVSSFSPEWQRDAFHTELSFLDSKNDMNILLKKLFHLECHLKTEIQTKCWKQWKRKFWFMLASEDILEDQTATRFVILLLYLKENILDTAFTSDWISSFHGGWLVKCSDLIDYVDEVTLYGELYQNVDKVMIYYEFSPVQSYPKEVEEVVQDIESIASLLDEVAKKTGIAEVVSGGTGIASGVLGGVGLGLAPFTAGASLIVSMVGLGVGLGSGLTAIASSITEKVHNNRKRKEVENRTKILTAKTAVLITILEKYASAITDLEEHSKSLKQFTNKEGVMVGLESANLIRSGVMTTLEIIDKAKQFKALLLPVGLLDDGAQMIKSAALPLDLIDEGVGVAKSAAAPGVASLKTATVVIGGIASAISIGFGIWQTVSASNKIKNGSELSKKFRDLANDFESSKNIILNAFDIPT